MANFLINLTATGDTPVVAAPVVPGQFIRVLGYHLTSNGPTVVTIKGDATTKDICHGTGVTAGGIVVPDSDQGAFDLPPNTALVFNNSTSALVGGAGNYVIKGPIQ